MNLSSRARAAVLVGVGAVLVGSASGITYAAVTAAPTNDYAIACSGPHHSLQLLNSAGRCPAGFWRIALASAPKSIMIRNVSSTIVSRTVDVRGMRIVAGCVPSGNSQLALTATNSNAIYDVRGADYLGQGETAGFNYNYNSMVTRTQHDDGPGYISYTASSNARSDITVQRGELTTNLIIAQAGHTFAISLYMQNNANSCFVEAQISQSS